MARPKRIEGVPTAREAIEESFWDLFVDKPLDKISVKEVCDQAGVNKTTFYYHFQDLRAVLDSIEQSCLPIEAPDMFTSLVGCENKQQEIAQFLTALAPRFERYCLLLSSKGDPDFAKKAKETMMRRWCEKLDMEYDELPSKTRIAIRFSMGGTTSIFADHGDGEPFDPDAFADVIASMVMPLLEETVSYNCHAKQSSSEQQDR